MSDTTNTNKPSWLRWIIGLSALFVVLFLIAAGLIWLFRNNIAEAYVSRYCEQRGLECQAEFADVGLNAAEISRVRIGPEGREALTTDTIKLAYTWPQRFQPALGPVSVDAPLLKIGFDGTALDLRGLDKLVASEGEGGGEPVNLTVTNGRVVLETPAGELTGQVDVSGTLPDEGEAIISFEPAELQAGLDRLSWSRGEARLTISEGQIEGTADVDIREAVLGTFTAENAVFSASLDGDDGAARVQWRGTTDAFRYSGHSLKGVETVGEANLSQLPDGGLESAIAALTNVTGELKAEAISLVGISGKDMTLHAELQQDGTRVTGPIAFTASSVSTQTGLARKASASGELSLDGGAIDFAGSGVLQGAGVYAPRQEGWLTAVRLPEPFEAHSAELKQALSKALFDFSTGADIVYHQRAGDWSLVASRPTALKSASGMTVSIEPNAAPEWLHLSPAGLRVSGEIIATGGGAPTLQADITAAEMTSDLLRIDASHLQLEPWTENDRTLTVDLAPVFMESGNQRTRLAAKGDVTISGSFPGTQLKPTTLSGGVEAGRSEAGWRVQTAGSQCLGLGTEGVSSGALTLNPVAVTICPEDGRFFREVDGKPTGKLTLGDVRLPFQTNDSSGELVLGASEVFWQLGEALRTEIRAERVTMPLVFGSGTFSVEGASPLLEMTTGDGPFRFNASLGESIVGGTIVPAEVSSGGFTFSGNSTATGLQGLIRSNDVRIEDYREDPLYQPMRADLTAKLSNGRVELTGPLRLQRSGRTIADARMDLDLTTLDGAAELAGQRLEFQPRGFQPYELSDRLRSILPNARGSLTANANFTIAGGDLSGTGKVIIDKLGFDTFRLGIIEGVSGNIVFSDILDLTTLPDQIVSIGMMDPGVLLQNGRLAFQIVGGEAMLLEGARWPFAGGELRIAPTRWEIGGDTELITITADKIELSELTEALSLKDISARGTVSGSFPLEIIGPDAYLRGAVLTADDKGGFLAYAGEGLEAAKGYGEFTDHAVEALKALNYEVLELGADGNLAGEIIVNLKLLGRNPKVLSGQPFEYDINVTSELAQLIRNTQSSLSSTVIIDQIRQEALEAAPVPADDE